MRLRADSATLRRELREREVNALFSCVPDNTFSAALELGAGDGFQGRILVRCTRSLLSTDINPGRLERKPHQKIEYGVCDAEEIPYTNREFDLIFSSNLLEHLEDPVTSVARMGLALRDDGIMIHTVPNRFWKFLHLSLFYPSQLLSLIERLDRRRPAASQHWDNNIRSVRPSFLRRHLWPPPHGVSHSNLEEFVRFGHGYWLSVFEKAGFQLVTFGHGLPAHSPYRFGFEIPRRLFEYAGFSSCTGYVLQKIGHSSPYARWFSPTSRT